MKVLGIIVNIFFPGIGTLIVGKIMEGIIQLLLLGLAAVLTFTLIGAVVGVPLAFVVWVWSIVSCVNIPDTPTVVHINLDSHTTERTHHPTHHTEHDRHVKPLIQQHGRSKHSVPIVTMSERQEPAFYRSNILDYSILREWDIRLKYNDKVKEAGNLIRSGLHLDRVSDKEKAFEAAFSELISIALIVKDDAKLIDIAADVVASRNEAIARYIN